ncbi:MAG: hypothetical protein ACE5EM_12140, partial [Sphingomonadales bacterium]
MGRFRYRAVSASGEVVGGEIEGRAQDAVIDRLIEMGFTPISAVTSDTGGLQRRLFQDVSFSTRVSRRDIVF